MAKAKAQGAFYLTVNGNGEFCPGLGWNHDALAMTLSMTSHFV